MIRTRFLHIYKQNLRSLQWTVPVSILQRSNCKTVQFCKIRYRPILPQQNVYHNTATNSTIMQQNVHFFPKCTLKLPNSAPALQRNSKLRILIRIFNILFHIERNFTKSAIFLEIKGLDNLSVWPVLRIWIGEPVPFWPLDPGWVKKSGSGSGMKNPDHISECLETIFWG